MWDIEDSMIGETVHIMTRDGETEAATVLAVSTTTANIKVRAHRDGQIMVGNQWE